ncbi:MAG: hydroxymethylbilane synthase [Frankiaceae bacterium]|jgi:hydroxymethylbilane synthase|nr:hydroxymethylbilane synthase [Frankiaceae bacterium]
MSAVVAGTLRLGTRRSALAMAQAGAVADALRGDGHDVELVEVVTTGDRSPGPLTQLGGTGVFAAELRSQLLAGDVDLAVHSLKDLPTKPADGLVTAAIPERADPRDALVSRERLRLTELAVGARVGTGSPRRAAQLRGLGLGLDVVGVRGNVDTRLRKVADGELDAVVLAAAGLARLGRLDEAAEVLDPGLVLPAPGQGALAVECRSTDEALAALLNDLLDDAATRAAVTAERSLLAALEAGCSAPVGALADVALGEAGDDELYLRGTVASVDGSHAIRLSATGPLADSEGLGRRLAAQLIEEGAADLIGENP